MIHYITIPDSLIHSVSIVPCKPDLKIVIIKTNLLKPVQHTRQLLSLSCSIFAKSFGRSPDHNSPVVYAKEGAL